MSSFYGNIINHTPRFSFDIVKIYPNRTTMERESSRDGVVFSQYVLINYNIDSNGKYNESNYSLNLQLDQNTYGIINGTSKDFLVNYDQTIWQKSYDKDKNLYYRAIDRMHDILPTFQDMSARNLVLEHMPEDYEGFGTTKLYGYYRINDKETADAFNLRYPISNTENLKKINIQVNSSGYWNVSEIQDRIQTALNTIEDSINNCNTILVSLEENIKNGTTVNKNEALNYITKSKELVLLLNEKSYYTEMMTWFMMFKQTISEVALHYKTNKDLWSNYQNTYGTNTLEYPTK